MHVQAKTDDVEALTQNTRVCTRRVHNNLHEYACMSGTYEHAKSGLRAL